MRRTSRRLLSRSVHFAKRTCRTLSKRGKLFLIGALLIVTALAAFALYFRNSEARWAWEQRHLPRLALLLDYSDADLALEIGNEYFGMTILGSTNPRYDPDLAERAFKEALAMHPGILWGHYQLARIAFARGDFTTALSEINAELAANPENLRSLYVRGLIYGYRAGPGDLALAEADFRRFTRWAPTEWAGYNDLSWILAKEGKDAQILPLIDTAFANVPQGEENPWLLNEQGLAYLNLGRAKDAQRSFEQALDYAQALTESEWRAAYTGDSPQNDTDGVHAFIRSIMDNLIEARGAQA